MHAVTMITGPPRLSNFGKKNMSIREQLAAEECEETFRNGIIKLVWFCTAPYGAAVTEVRWNSQPLGCPLRQLCSVAVGEIIFAI